MLKIQLDEVEVFNNETSTFARQAKKTLLLEHSLVSISKWESIWEVPFIDDRPKEDSVLLNYIQLMGVEDDLTNEDLSRLSQEQLSLITTYITSKQTATWFAETKRSNLPNKAVMTAEVFYAMMTLHRIPFECQYWHINRLLTLIKVINAKREEAEQMANGKTKRPATRSDLNARRDLNRQRREAVNTKG